MKNEPLVSVFLPTYNQEKFIAASIDSVISQDYKSLEIIIGDDCSNDNTWKIVQEYKSKYPEKIKAFQNIRNLGITGNCNKILNQCNGKYVVFGAGDDLFLPGKISSQVRAMEKDSNIIISYHDIEVFQSEENKTLRYWNKGNLSNKPIYGSALKVVKSIIKNGTVFMASASVMARRNAIPISGYDERIPVASDWLMWIEILANNLEIGKVVFNPEVLSRYRRHEKNITSAGYKHTADEYVTLAIVEDKYPFLAKYVVKGIARVRYSHAIRVICSGKYKEGRTLLFLSLFSRFISWKIIYWLTVSYIPVILKYREKLKKNER